MPRDAPTTKGAATEGYGASVVSYDRYNEDREALAGELANDRGLAPIPAYGDPLKMAGQATAALELVADANDLDVLVVPMSGGGLITGCGTPARALLPGGELIGAEPAAGTDTKRSLAAGERVRIPVPHTITDGRQAELPDKLTFEVNSRQVNQVLLVDDDLTDAMRFLLERLKVVVEPSGVSALNTVLINPDHFRARRVGVILSGGNIGTDRFPSLLAVERT